MKRILSCIVSALVAVSLAGLVWAIDTPHTEAVPADAQPGATMKDDASTKTVKKAKKKKKKAKKATKKQMEEKSDMGAAPEATPAPK